MIKQQASREGNTMRSILSIAAVTMTVFGGYQVSAQTLIPPTPKDFVSGAMQSDQYEIMAAHVAIVQAVDPRVQSFAETMLKDHAQLNVDWRMAAAASGLPAPDAGMSSDQAALLSGLQSLRGSAFDKAYAHQQELAHTQAVAVDESFATSGPDSALRKTAQAALPRLKDHLTMAHQLRQSLDGS